MISSQHLNTKNRPQFRWHCYDLPEMGRPMIWGWSMWIIIYRSARLPCVIRLLTGECTILSYSMLSMFYCFFVFCDNYTCNHLIRLEVSPAWPVCRNLLQLYRKHWGRVGCVAPFGFSQLMLVIYLLCFFSSIKPYSGFTSRDFVVNFHLRVGGYSIANGVATAVGAEATIFLLMISRLNFVFKEQREENENEVRAKIFIL